MNSLEAFLQIQLKLQEVNICSEQTQIHFILTHVSGLRQISVNIVQESQGKIKMKQKLEYQIIQHGQPWPSEHLIKKNIEVLLSKIIFWLTDDPRLHCNQICWCVCITLRACQYTSCYSNTSASEEDLQLLGVYELHDQTLSKNKSITK